MNSNSRNLALHKDIMRQLKSQFKKPVMNNVYRSDYVECLIALKLGTDWKLTWDWAPWDCENKSNKAQLEVKQSAARQTWDREPVARKRSPSFDIGHRKQIWTKDGKTKVLSSKTSG